MTDNTPTLETLRTTLVGYGVAQGKIEQLRDDAKRKRGHADAIQKEMLARVKASGMNKASRQVTKDIVVGICDNLREDADAMTTGAESATGQLTIRAKAADAMISALKPELTGKRGAELGRRVAAAVKGFLS